MILKGYSNYEIDPEAGTVLSYKTNRLIGYKNRYGYWVCCIYSDDNTPQHWQMHRLIWTVVNGEIPDGMEINHIDENKDNNSISNLNLMTPKENNNWGTRNKRSAETRQNNIHSRPIVALQNNNVKIYFPSICDAKRKGFHKSNIIHCLNKQRTTHKKYQFKYLDDVLGDWLEEIQDEDMKN